MQCTGISAGWCPIHGDCTCFDPDDKNDDWCPLHSEASTHGELRGIDTIWGMVAYADISGSELNDGAWR